MIGLCSSWRFFQFHFTFFSKKSKRRFLWVKDSWSSSFSFIYFWFNFFLNFSMAAFSFRNTDLVVARELHFSLKLIFGLGLSTVSWFLTRIGLGRSFFSSCLNSYFISNLLGFLNLTLRSETKIRRAMEVRIKMLKDLNNWRGKRHSLFLPTRGQRSRTNARTQKAVRFLKKFEDVA